MTDLKVGDVVTWRSGHENRPNGVAPLGIANCVVVELGEADGQPAAMIRLPHPMGPMPVGAYTADLYRE